MKTTIDIDVGPILEETIDEFIGEIEVAIDNIRKYQPTETHHCEPVDIRDLLNGEHAIALIWDTEQVRSHYPHLSEEQAWEILQQCERDYKGEEGLTWDDIAETVAELHPDPDGFLMPERIARCEKAFEQYTDCDDANLTDLLADLMHWAKRKGHCFGDALDTARMHFDHETPAGSEEA